MIRPHSGNKLFFNECIAVFRPGDRDKRDIEFHSSVDEFNGIILSPFKITTQWDLEKCTIYPSNIVDLDGNTRAFVSIVKVKDIPEIFANLYIHALCAILSLITSSPFKAPVNLDEYTSFTNFPNLNQEQLKKIGKYHFFKASGVGRSTVDVTDDQELNYIKESNEIIKELQRVQYDIYMFFMQSARMIQLSLINRREDFGLAYHLVVSAIESVAQKVVKRDHVKDKHASEKLWIEKSKNDKDFAELYKAYKDSRGGNQFLQDRYIKFISDYVPIAQWRSILVKRGIHFDDDEQTDKDSEKKFQNFFKENLSEEDVKDLLKQTYNYRSIYVHRGQQPPFPYIGDNNFFDTSFIDNGNTIETITLINYEFLLTIAKISFVKWIESKRK